MSEEKENIWSYFRVGVFFLIIGSTIVISVSVVVTVLQNVWEVLGHGSNMETGDIIQLSENTLRKNIVSGILFVG